MSKNLKKISELFTQKWSFSTNHKVIDTLFNKCVVLFKYLFRIMYNCFDFIYRFSYFVYKHNLILFYVVITLLYILLCMFISDNEGYMFFQVECLAFEIFNTFEDYDLFMESIIN